MACMAMSAGDVRPPALSADGSSASVRLPSTAGSLRTLKISMGEVRSPELQEAAKAKPPAAAGDAKPELQEAAKAKPLAPASVAKPQCGGNSSGLRGKDPVDANVVLQVLPWLLLLLVGAGFAWCCCSSFTVQGDATAATPQAAQEAAATSVATATPQNFSWGAAVEQEDEHLDNMPLPVIAMLIVGGYTAAILSMMYLPRWLGPEGSIWALLTALVLLLTWRWLPNLLYELVIMVVSSLPLTICAILAAVCVVLYPVLQILRSAGPFIKDNAHFSTQHVGKNTAQSTLPKVKSLESVVLEQKPTPLIGDVSCSISGSLEAISKAVEKPVTVAVPAQLQDVSIALKAVSSAPAHTRSEAGSAVYLHIYDVTHDGRIERLNSLLAPRLCPVKLGGIFHAGVEVNGKEWSFGHCTLGSGVHGIQPRAHPAHKFRETITLPCTQLSEEKIAGIIKAIQSEYQGCHYNILRRNCIHFADDLCARLGVGGVPLWVHRLARTGEWLCDGLMRISQMLEDNGGYLNCCAKNAAS